MVPLRFDRARIEGFLALAGEHLAGEWLRVGGAAAASWFAAARTTEDVALVALACGNAERLALMQLAERAGIPVEAVNSTADYVVRKVAGWRAMFQLRRARSSALLRHVRCSAVVD